MGFDAGIGLSEMVIIGVVALLVVGPKDLPFMLRKVGGFVRKMRAMASDFQNSFDELARQAELDELRKEIDQLRELNPINKVQNEITNALDLAGDYSKNTPITYADATSDEALNAQAAIANERAAAVLKAPKAKKSITVKPPINNAAAKNTANKKLAAPKPSPKATSKTTAKTAAKSPSAKKPSGKPKISETA